MPVRYVLQDNRLTPDPNDRYAQSRPLRAVGLDEVIDRIADSGTTLTRPDLVSVFSAYQRIVPALLAEGYNVNTPTANFTARIQGTFDGDNDQYDPARHAIVPQVSAGAELRQALSKGVTTEKLTAERPTPSLRRYFDHVAEETDGALTPGGVGEIVGARLAFDKADVAQGVFFVAEAGGAETRAEVYPQVAPKRVMVLIPAGLAAGTYHVRVRAAFGEEVRTGLLDAPLTVA